MIGSTDAEAFYPSIDIAMAAEEVIESEVKIDGVDMEEVALYLACTMTQEEIDKKKVVHMWCTHGGLRKAQGRASPVKQSLGDPRPEQRTRAGCHPGGSQERGKPER